MADFYQVLQLVKHFASVLVTFALQNQSSVLVEHAQARDPVSRVVSGQFGRGADFIEGQSGPIHLFGTHEFKHVWLGLILCYKQDLELSLVRILMVIGRDQCRRKATAIRTPPGTEIKDQIRSFAELRRLDWNQLLLLQYYQIL